MEMEVGRFTTIKLYKTRKYLIWNETYGFRTKMCTLGIVVTHPAIPEDTITFIPNIL